MSSNYPNPGQGQSSYSNRPPYPTPPSPPQPVYPPQPSYPPQPAYSSRSASSQPAYQAPISYRPAPGTTSILVMGILSLVFSCTYYLSFLGIIFGAIALNKTKKLTAAGYPMTGKARAGKIMGLIGLIIGCVIVAIIIFVILAALGIALI